jgi:hypothetical protein
MAPKRRTAAQVKKALASSKGKAFGYAGPRRSKSASLAIYKKQKGS